MTQNEKDDRNILPDVASDPISAAEELREEIGGVRKKLYRCLGKAVAIAEVLEADDAKYTRFKARVASEALHVAKSPLRTVMCFLFRAKEPRGPAYERACCYARAIARLRKDPTVSASEIADLIRERGGIEELYAEAKNASTSAGKNPEAQDEGTAEIDREQEPERTVVAIGEGDADTSSPAPAVTSSAGLSSGGKKSTSNDEKKEEATDEPRKYSKAWCEQRLVLEISSAYLNRILNMRDRQRGSIDFVRSGKDSTGFKIFNVEGLTAK